MSILLKKYRKNFWVPFGRFDRTCLKKFYSTRPLALRSNSNWLRLLRLVAALAFDNLINWKCDIWAKGEEKETKPILALRKIPLSLSLQGLLTEREG